MSELSLEYGPKKKGVLIEIAKFTIVAFLVVTPFRWFVAQPFIVSGVSMAPTIEADEYLVIDKMSYRFNEPARGDIVIFQYPLDPSLYFIKRIIGLPGETIVIREKGVIVRREDGSSLALFEPYAHSDSGAYRSSTTTLAANEYFLMGDNRSASSDSRVWGPLPKKYIIGRAFLSLYPIRTLSFLPGKYSPE